MNAPVKQHLIDPAVCIRCNTCEATCPVGAVTHDANNYVVDPEKCNFCMDCVSPCPTGSIDHFVMVTKPHSLDDQFSWFDLPPEEEVPESTADPAPTASVEAIDDEAAALLADAHKGAGGKVKAPASASKPRVNLFDRRNPAKAKVTGMLRLTGADASADIRHIILDFGTTPFPVLEGQSIGILPPGEDANGRPHMMRLYSIASARDGERPNTNNLALTVKRVSEPRPDGATHHGVASNYMCDLKQGDPVSVVGPFGSTFLKPDDSNCDIIMICTGTGSAPFRAFTERRRRAMPSAKGKLLMFFGARAPKELPYFGPLQRVPKSLLDQELVFSRLPDTPKEYVQDRMRKRSGDIAELLKRSTTHIYVCGLRGMEAGVEESFLAICREHSLDWKSLRETMRGDGRYHVETY
ncbi:benzoyl-CoA oxygenase component A [Variibacter gotjawalensis]|uniref:Benzoyl-CoA oxygenase component A n=1 Tax=Variibacter gotjawalensis TaxID=1333996 RepID=A0A0S3PRK9_9BRAD|nr:benzoyl-CoA 2,3-epoxidase subunit BoxA [Variibacter gotjawalensis]NIK48821.1 benzoyl-CoA 2,3-dioxygenase component A [Variibacter gotjawalensis]RZS50681.1 benzoyl-CoA oxygenase subunit A [Variibacter gotjawalensis]BAT58515.1 benzoyl-CoA oxygenase component A [Variibacter gotjawalensis]